MMTTRPAALLPLLIALLLTACGAADQEGPVGTVPDEESTTVSPAPDPATSGKVEAAVADLASRLGVPEDEITVVTSESVTWGDTSLGCPQPGMRYAQVVQDGTYIELEHDGTTYPYHSGGERPDPFLCEQVDATGGPASTTDDG